MKIAMISSALRPDNYISYETRSHIVHLLVEGLTSRNIEVGIFPASGISQIDRSPYEGSIFIDKRTDVYRALADEYAAFSRFLDSIDTFDLVHYHDGFFPLAFNSFLKVPTIYTHYGAIDSRVLRLCGKSRDRCFYTSLAQADRHPNLEYAATVYPAIEPNRFLFQHRRGRYLVCWAPMRAGYGVEKAVEAARRTGFDLILVGPVQDDSYFSAEIAPHLTGNRIRHLVYPTSEERNDLLGNALAIVHMAEPGYALPLPLLEANACGTPIVGLNEGVLPEIIESEANGLLCRDMDEVVASIPAMADWDRSRCRGVVEKRFGHKEMVDAYVSVYETILRKSKPHAHISHPPWGVWTVLEDTPTYKVKRVDVLPGKRLSYQKHFKRTEHWTIVSGEAAVTLDGRRISLKAGDYIDIPFEACHRIENTGSDVMTFIEVQQGSYFGEDDIIRIEDDHGRAGTIL